MLSCESAWHSSDPWVHLSTTANTPICCKCWCTCHVQQWYTWKPNALVWLELGPCFGGWNRLKIVGIQRLLTLPTPNLSHPTACLGRLLCGCGCKCQKGSVASLGFFMWMCHAWKTETKVPRRKTCIWSICLVWGNEKQQILVPGMSHMPHTCEENWNEMHRSFQNLLNISGIL